MTVLHVITDLSDGGAQRVLASLATAPHASTRPVVVSLSPRGKYSGVLERAGVEVHALDMPSGRLTAAGLLRLLRLMRTSRPDLVQTWMYHADLVGGVAARLALRPVVWGLRNTTLDANQAKRATRVVRRLCTWLSGVVPAAIVSCSERGVLEHRWLGYADKFVVVPNGYDTDSFAPSPDARARIRSEWNIAASTPLLGSVGRWSVEKDRPSLLRALQVVRETDASVRCALIGPGCKASEPGVVAAVAASGAGDAVVLAGGRADIPAVMNALDLLVLSSRSEAFPNVVAEAMACGTPCVVTDVGDAAAIVGDTGWIVPPGNPRALGTAILQALRAREDSEAWQARQQACRQRIVERYGLDRMVSAYEALWREL